MTQLEALRALVDETDDTILTTCLNIAGRKICNRCYPFRECTTVPQKYYALQIEIAAYLVNKMGAEGEIAHNENGINRTYESASVPESMLREITPFIGTFGGADNALS